MTQTTDKSSKHFSEITNPFNGQRLFADDGTTNSRGAAMYLGIGEGQIHQMLKNNRLVDAAQVDGKWRVSKEALDLYEATKGQRAPGGNAAAGRVKVFGWVTLDDLKNLNAAGYNFRQKQTKGSTAPANGSASNASDEDDGE